MTIDPHDTGLLPHQPGVYKFFNRHNKLIYVGKAKDLRKRVKSYFTARRNQSLKTRKLISEINKIEVIVTPSEFDALLLENNLIKAHQPRYNILLKDDKSFPFICVSNERFPRIYATRQINKNKGTYYGPYTSVVAMNNVLELVHRLYTLRTCTYNLSEKNIKAGKYKVCLEYHIGNCRGPCAGKQQEASYLTDLEQAVQIIKGNLTVPREYFKRQMQRAASELRFEEAQQAKEKLQLLERFYAKTIVVNPRLGNLHILTATADDDTVFVNYMQVNQGAVMQSITRTIRNKLDLAMPDLLAAVVPQLISLNDQEKMTLLSNYSIAGMPENITVVVPKIGDKRKLVEMSLKNAYNLKKQHKSKPEAAKTKQLYALEQLQKDLSLTTLPEHIECFDNSNLQGSQPVASMVCFKNGVPSKHDYRKFNIKTVSGPDDFASMQEIVTRRYRRLLAEEGDLPDLIVIDGGKGQLNAAVKALKELGIYGQIPLIGIAKKLEEIYLPDDPLPLHISKKSSSLKLLQRIRDEAHRFAITFHRQKRSSTITTKLQELPGIGTHTADKLLAAFRSVKKIKQASQEELARVVGKAKAAIIVQAIKKGSI